MSEPASTSRERPPQRPWRPAISLREALLLLCVVCVLLAWRRDHVQLSHELRITTARIEVYTDRKAFEKRLRSLSPLVEVDFDDIDTSQRDVVAFQGDRYRSRGLVLRGDGLHAGRTFGFPGKYPPASKPNGMTPGPLTAQSGKGVTATFVKNGNAPRRVAAFGVTFVDVDYPDGGVSSLTAFGIDSRRLAKVSGFQGPDAAPVFRGVVAVDKNGELVPAIERVHIQNGGGWPGVKDGDGVLLDDFQFSTPE